MNGMRCGIGVGAVIIASVLCTAGEARPTQAGGRLGTLEVMIDGFRSARGHARVALFNRDAGFPDNESAAYRSALTEIANGRVHVRFEDLPFGPYAVSMYHDENDDARFNKGLFGIPKEGYGVSQNIVHATRAPRFREALFDLADGVQHITLRVHY
jgi:uncharacterized protein (DUF2141 family)